MAANPVARIRETGWIDYLLCAVLGCLALFTCGQGIAQPEAAWILIGIYSVGTGCSFAIGGKLRGTKFAGFDGPLYSIVAAIALFGQPALNQLLPADTFPPELRSAGLLSWLLCLGSFAGWRDATRLFQAVPALALFGLVGVYDTYPNAPFVFFGFLLCLALMFGRAHARAMLLQASRSGFARIEEGVSLSEAGVDKDSMLRSMRRGPWRWMAGPEWAVASAGAVILVSLFGAPIIHDSVQGVAGLVHINVPPRLRQQQQGTAPLTTESLQRLGQGPRRLNQVVVGFAQLDHARYLRSIVYERYIGGSWAESANQFGNISPDLLAIELEGIEKPRHFEFAVTMIDSFWAQRIPVPSEVESITDPANATVHLDGTISSPGVTGVHGKAVESSIGFGPQTPPENLVARGVGEDSAASPKVHELVTATIAHSKNDYEKAMALMGAIVDHAKYNLRAKAVPRDQDPVDYFLFTSHEGYCDLFASAMVVMSRDAGMDAHYVVGYLTEEADTDHYGRYVIRQSAAHSWAEIYFSGIGWVIFDPTQEAEDITPKSAEGIAAIGWSWLPVVLGLAVLAGIVYYGPRLRMNLRLPQGAVRQRRVDQLYGQFVRNLSRRANKRKPPSATPDAWLATIRSSLGSAATEAERVNALFVRTLYSRDAITEDRLNSLRLAIRQFKRVRR